MFIDLTKVKTCACKVRSTMNTLLRINSKMRRRINRSKLPKKKLRKKKVESITTLLKV